jgi:hypothetical protein
MPRATHEVADVIRLFGDELRAPATVSPARQRVMRATGRLPHRGARRPRRVVRLVRLPRIAYNSCRNRHCPKCQGSRQAQWLEDRAADLLPVEYFHVVFTMPEELARHRAAEQARGLRHPVRRVGGDAAHDRRRRKHLGAEIGFMSVLHTWSQDLRHHPHVHCVVPGGGLTTRWPLGRVPSAGSSCRCASWPRCSAASSWRSCARRTSAGELKFQGSLRQLRERGAFAACSTGRWQAVGRLQQAAVRRAGAGPEVPRALHAPRRDRQPAHPRSRRIWREVPLARSRPGGSALAHGDYVLPTWSSCGASCCTCCRAASRGSGTTACSATRAATVERLARTATDSLASREPTPHGLLRGARTDRMPIADSAAASSN